VDDFLTADETNTLTPSRPSRPKFERKEEQSRTAMTKEKLTRANDIVAIAGAAYEAYSEGSCGD
jgi:hypothetical protein